MPSRKSTIGRSIPIRLRMVRLAFGLLEPVAPQVGARLLDRIWFKLPVVPERARRLRVELPAGTPFEVGFEGRTVRGTSWGSGPVVYLVHGWGGWGLQLAAYVPPLVEAGFRVAAFDGPSHGESDAGRDGPGRGTLVELADAFLAVVAAQGPAYGVVAHSMGASVVSEALAAGLKARRVVFLAAATDFGHTVRELQAMFGFGPRIREGFLRRFTRRFGRPMEAFDLTVVIEDLLEERDVPPLLAIHDQADRETPYQGSVAIGRVWPGAEVELTEGLGHRQVLWEPAVVASAVAFLSTDQMSGHEVAAGQGTMRG